MVLSIKGARAQLSDGNLLLDDKSNSVFILQLVNSYMEIRLMGVELNAVELKGFQVEQGLC